MNDNIGIPWPWCRCARLEPAGRPCAALRIKITEVYGKIHRNFRESADGSKGTERR